MRTKEILETVEKTPGSALFYTPRYFRKGISYFFNKPEIILKAYNPEELTELLDKVEKYEEKGLKGYGYINYESGAKNSKDRSQNSEYAKFCLFDELNTLSFRSKYDELGNVDILSAFDKYSISNFKPETDKERFIKDIDRIKKYISEGDTYQVNYTIKTTFDFEGDIISLFLKLIYSQTAEYTSFINDGSRYILSLSPELFFEKKGEKIICKPMKGTAKRCYNEGNDLEIKNKLSESIKNRAENVMIVDLLRNDLSKIDADVNIKVRSLFDIEEYETLYQMTSKIVARYNNKIKLSQIINNIFPCGSITGAPKIRTMEIIHELEKSPRGIYTGALGIVNKEKTIFSVPIRTITIDSKTKIGEMGIGSGIVWDSKPEEEYKETLLKSKFLTEPAEYFYLFETMLIENNSVFLLDEHIERLHSAADFFMFYFDEHKIRSEVSKILYKIKDKNKYKFRLLLYKWDRIKCEVSKYEDYEKKGKIAVSKKIVDSTNRFQYFKTSKRDVYDSEYKKCSEQGFFDVVFLNKRGELTEGAISNIFIKQGGKWFTPEINCGLLNGVYRKHFISQNPDCVETKLYLDNLMNADEIIMTNSVRKEVKVLSVNQS